MTWEYKTVQIARDCCNENEQLNDLGKDGWELVSIVVPDAGLRFYFKRPLQTVCDSEKKDKKHS